MWISGLPVVSASNFPSARELRPDGQPLPTPTPRETFVPGVRQDAAEETPARKINAGRWLGVGLALGLVGLGAACSFLPQQAPPAVAVVVQNEGTPASALEASSLVQGRHAPNLSSGRILKFDQYPTLQNPELSETVPGAPNFRDVAGTRVHGVAQPTVEGMRNVLKRLGAESKTVMWTTMREEPVLYVNGRSVTLRELAHPFANLEQPGLTGAQVEAQEEALKAEVQREAALHGNRILLHEEAPDGTVQARWMPIESLQTPREVFAQMNREGLHVDYARIPVTDEKAPEEADFDALVARFKNVPAGTEMVLNCHAGRGRTTTAMVVADLMTSPPGRLTRHPAVHQDIREQGQFEQGNYRVILGLIQGLEKGAEAKDGADAAIDRNAAMQNLRTSIARLKQQADGGDAKALSRGQDYLKRYFYLVSFSEYLKEQQPQGFAVPFSQWMGQHPELRGLLDSMQLALNQGVPGGPQYA